MVAQALWAPQTALLKGLAGGPGAGVFSTSDNTYYVNCVITQKEGLESLGGAIRARGKKSVVLLNLP